MANRSNRTLDAALDQMVDGAECNFRQRVAVKVCLLMPRKRRELERALTEMAVATGAVRPQSTKDAAFAGDWRDIAEWLWEHRQEILDFVMTIISLF